MAVAFTGAGTAVAASGASPQAVTTATALAVGDVLVALLSYDNSGSSGADPMTGTLTPTPVTGALSASISAQTGLNDPSSASSGICARCVAWKVTTAIPSGTVINFAWSGTVVVRALALMKVTGAGSVVNFRTNSGATGANAAGATTIAHTTPSVPNGDGVLCWAAHENGAAITGDADTTNGSWSAVYGNFTGSAAAGVAAYFQSKVVNATATQTFNPTGTSSDWIAGSIVFTELAAVTPATRTTTWNILSSDVSPARLFDGIDDNISFNPSSLVGMTYGTFAALVRIDATQTTFVASAPIGLYTSTNTDVLVMKAYRIGGNNGWLSLMIDGTSQDIAWPNADTTSWRLVVVQKGTGSVAGRAWVYDYTTGTWTINNASMGSAVANAARTVAKLNVGGELTDPAFLKGDVAAVAAWKNVVLSDAQVKTLINNYQAWAVTNPTAFKILDQNPVAAVVDEVDAGSTQSAIVGTAVSPNAAPIRALVTTSLTTTWTALTSVSAARTTTWNVAAPTGGGTATVGAHTYFTSGGTSCTVATPAHSPGDLLVWFMGNNQGQPSPSYQVPDASAGAWVLAGQVTGNYGGYSPNGSVYLRIAGASEPSTFQCNSPGGSGGQNHSVAMVAVSGAAAAATATADIEVLTGEHGSGPLNLPGVTVPTGGVALAFATSYPGFGNSDPPASGPWATLDNWDPGVSIRFTGTGTTPTCVIPYGGGDTAGVLIAIAPGGGGGTTAVSASRTTTWNVAAPTGGTTFNLSDNFNRANGALGSNWASLSGATQPVIVSNAIEASAALTDTAVVVSGTTYAVQSVAMDIVLGADYSEAGAIMHATNTTELLFCVFTTDGTHPAFPGFGTIDGPALQLYYGHSSAYTMVAERSVPAATGTHRLYAIALESNQIELWFDGVRLLTGTDDGAVARTGKPGITQHHATTPARLDNAVVWSNATNPPEPTITSITPSAGYPGDTLTITGTGFIADAMMLSYGESQRAPITVTSPTTATFVIPADISLGPASPGFRTPGGITWYDFMVLDPLGPTFGPTTEISNNSTTSHTSITVAAPPGISGAADQRVYLCLFVAPTSSNPGINTPTGFAPVGGPHIDTLMNGFGIWTAVQWFVSTTDHSADTTFTVTFNSSVIISRLVAGVVYNTTGVEATDGYASTLGSSLATPSLTTTTANSGVLLMVTVDPTATVNPPSGFAGLGVNGTDQPDLNMYSMLQPTAGASSTATISIFGSSSALIAATIGWKAPVASPFPFYDDFERADGDPGANYEVFSGAFSIISGTLKGTGLGGNWGQGYIAPTPPSADQYVEYTCPVPTAFGGADGYLRASGGFGTLTGYVIWWYWDGGGLFQVGFGDTVAGVSGTGGVTVEPGFPSAPFTIRGEIIGTTYRLLYNGTQVGTGTIATVSQVGRMALDAYDNGRYNSVGFGLTSVTTPVTASRTTTWNIEPLFWKGTGVITDWHPNLAADLATVKAGWWYDWTNYQVGAGRTDPVYHAPNSAYVPMIWGDWISDSRLGPPPDGWDLGAGPYAGEKIILGFNEPDDGNQSNMSVSRALALWPQLEATGARLGSPAGTGGSTSWLADFMDGDGAGYVPRVDFICLHFYPGLNGSMTDFANYLDYMHGLYNKPIWVTEFSALQGDVASNAALVDQVMAVCLARPWVERLGWFILGPFPQFPGTKLVESNGALTATGAEYDDYPERTVLAGTTQVTASRTTTWATRSTITAARATTWVTRFAVAPATRVTTWVTRANVAANRATTWGTLAAVSATATRSTTWVTKAGVTTARVTTWSTLAAIAAPATRSTTWRTLVAVTTNRATTWNVIQGVMASRTTLWNVSGSLTLVTTSRSTTWSVYTPVTTARSTAWAVLSTLAVPATRSTTWNTSALVQAARSTTWQVLVPIAAPATRTTSWVTKAVVSQTRVSTWNTLTAVPPASRSTTWVTWAQVLTNRSTSWNVAGLLNFVTTSRTTTWVTKANVSQAVPTSWAVLIKVAATATRSTTWATLAPVATASRSTTWNVIGRVIATRSTTWNTLGSLYFVTASRSTTWSTHVLVSANRTTMWNTLVPIVVLRVTTWRVLRGVTAARTTRWNVTSPLFRVTVSCLTRWSVAPSAPSHNYLVLYPNTVMYHGEHLIKALYQTDAVGTAVKIWPPSG